MGAEHIRIDIIKLIQGDGNAGNPSCPPMHHGRMFYFYGVADSRDLSRSVYVISVFKQGRSIEATFDEHFFIFQLCVHGDKNYSHASHRQKVNHFVPIIVNSSRNAVLPSIMIENRNLLVYFPAEYQFHTYLSYTASRLLIVEFVHLWCVGYDYDRQLTDFNFPADAPNSYLV